MGNVENGVTDNLPRPGLKQSLVGPQLAFAFLQELLNDLQRSVGTGTIKILKIPYLNQNMFEFSVKGTRELSGLNRNQVRHATGRTTNRKLSLESLKTSEN
jgi:hypothetical protein